MVGNACVDGQHGREADRGTVVWVLASPSIQSAYTVQCTEYSPSRSLLPISITIFPDDSFIKTLSLDVGEYAPHMQHTALNPNPTP